MMLLFLSDMFNPVWMGESLRPVPDLDYSASVVVISGNKRTYGEKEDEKIS
jgi:hypothetical protein